MMAAIGAGFAACRVLPPADARHLQGAAVPRRRRGDPRRRQQRRRRHGRPRAEDAADGDRLPGRHAVARRRAALRRLRVEGRSARIRCSRAASPVPFAMLLAAAFLTAFYMFRVVFLAFFAERADETIGHRPSDAADSTDTAHHGHGVGSLAHAHDAPFADDGPAVGPGDHRDGHRHLLDGAPAARRVRGAGLADAGRGRRSRSPAS